MRLISRIKKSNFLTKLLGPEIMRADNRRLILRFLNVLLFIILLLLLSSYLVWLFELKGRSDSSLSIRSFWDGLWWAVVTIATVGYGDKVPQTSAGRTVGYILIIVGFLLLSVFTGLIASLFVEDKIKGAKGLKQIRAHNHIVICGWNKSAISLLNALKEKFVNDLAICIITNQGSEFFENLESQFSSLELRFVRGEATQEEVLKRASISTAAQVIILADQSLDNQVADDRSIIIANTIQYMLSKNKITVQLLNPDNKGLLHRSGFSNIMVYDDIGGYILANNILDNSSLCIYSQLLKAHSNQICTQNIPDSYKGKSYGELFDHIYKDEKKLLLGLISKEAELELDSIFSDNSSAIDQFIKTTLAKSARLKAEDKANIRWNPPRDSVIQESDHAIVI